MTLTQTNQLSADICPVARTAEIISGKWTLLIIRDLTTGVKRFHQLERSLQGISPKTLSERLDTLEAEGIVIRETFAEVPPRVEYSLTAKGHDLLAVIESMRVYGTRWLCNK
jgi:DNA-binding HxlR family transcriptional regulator